MDASLQANGVSKYSVYSTNDFLLETKEPGEEWRLPGETSIYVQVYDSIIGGFKPKKRMWVAVHKETVLDFKKKISQKFNIPIEHQRLFEHYGHPIKEFKNQGNESLVVFNLMMDQSVYVEEDSEVDENEKHVVPTEKTKVATLLRSRPSFWDDREIGIKIKSCHQFDE